MKFILFKKKTGRFLPALQTWVYIKVISPLLPPASLLPAGCRAQGDNDEAVNDLNLLFLLDFIFKSGQTFQKLPFSTFGPKQCFYLTQSAWEYFEKLALRKKECNLKRLYLKSYGKFRVETKILRNFI